MQRIVFVSLMTIQSICNVLNVCRGLYYIQRHSLLCLKSVNHFVLTLLQFHLDMRWGISEMVSEVGLLEDLETLLANLPSSSSTLQLVGRRKKISQRSSLLNAAVKRVLP